MKKANHPSAQQYFKFLWSNSNSGGLSNQQKPICKITLFYYLFHENYYWFISLNITQMHTFCFGLRGTTLVSYHLYQKNFLLSHHPWLKHKCKQQVIVVDLFFFILNVSPFPVSGGKT